MTTLADIQKSAATLSAARDILADQLRAMQARLDAVTGDALPDLKKVARKVSKLHLELDQLIRANPSLFLKPRTHVVDGLKFGMNKRPGKIDWADDAKVCNRIRDLVKDGTLTADQQAILITTAEKPVSKALEKLEGKILKRLGVSVGEDCDVTVIASVDGQVEKMIAAMVKDATKDSEAEVVAE